MDFKEFLVKAKKETYASGRKAKILKDGFEELSFKKGVYSYRDRWKGSKPFGGQEVVWKNGKLFWVMNYFGGVTSKIVDSKEVYIFLRKSLSRVKKRRPFRGPSTFKEGNFTYTDGGDLNIGRFKGTERIFWRGKEIYRLEYHGGEVI